MKADRMLEMERYVLQKGAATMEELREHFDVSMNTVRRDVAQLLTRGMVEKVYGGVCARKNEQSLTPYDVRRLGSEDAKAAIGKRAAELVNDGDIIFIDSGTTTLHMIDHLASKRELTIITNNLEAINRALPYENINIIALPGQVRRKTRSFTGDDAVRYLRRFNVRIAFMASTGLSSHGVTNSSPMEYEIKKCAVESAETTVLLIAQPKFGVTGLMTFAQLEDFDILITDCQPAPEDQARLKACGAQLIVAGQN
ncbi:MAG: DeoR/GlpR transcriptional regulator [Clostridiales bacterium]|nr:DeoR/GlpR transcriptional regulator [Clostridiales bacterium]